jgi:hypothetical protein
MFFALRARTTRTSLLFNSIKNSGISMSENKEEEIWV